MKQPARFLLLHGEMHEIPARGAGMQALAGEIEAFAKARKVSRKMVAYNMLRSELISGAIYRRLAERFDADRLEQARRPAGGAADYYVVRRHRVGQGLIRLVGRLVAGGALTATKAGKVLGVQPAAVGRMTESARAA